MGNLILMKNLMILLNEYDAIQGTFEIEVIDKDLEKFVIN